MFPLFMHIRYFLWRVFESSRFGPSGHSTDPFAGVCVPKRHGPSGSTTAVAVMEPND